MAQNTIPAALHTVVKSEPFFPTKILCMLFTTVTYQFHMFYELIESMDINKCDNIK